MSSRVLKKVKVDKVVRHEGNKALLSRFDLQIGLDSGVFCTTGLFDFVTNERPSQSKDRERFCACQDTIGIQSDTI